MIALAVSPPHTKPNHLIRLGFFILFILWYAIQCAHLMLAAILPEWITLDIDPVRCPVIDDVSLS